MHETRIPFRCAPTKHSRLPPFCVGIWGMNAKEMLPATDAKNRDLRGNAILEALSNFLGEFRCKSLVCVIKKAHSHAACSSPKLRCSANPPGFDGPKRSLRNTLSVNSRATATVSSVL